MSRNADYTALKSAWEIEHQTNDRLREINAELLAALKVAQPHVNQAAKDAKAGWVDQRRVGTYAADLEAIDAAIAKAESNG